MRTLIFCLLLLIPAIGTAYDLGCSSLWQYQHSRWLDAADTDSAPRLDCRLAYTSHHHQLSGWLPGYGRYQLSSSANAMVYQLEQGLFASRQGNLMSLVYRQWQQTDTQEITQDHIYQSSNGLLAVGQDAELTLNSSGQQVEGRWVISGQLPYFLRYAGIYWRYQLQPAELQVADDLADIYDTRIRLWGVSLGRNEEQKGLSFNWRLAIGQGVMQADSASIQKHHDYNLWHLQTEFSWQYRYYFAPYWYGLIDTGLSLEQWQSGNLDPGLIRFKPYHQYQGHLGLGLRYYF